MRTSLTYLIFILSFSFGQSIPVWAQYLHVAVDGSDQNGDGSLSNPFATMTEASAHVQPGDTVFVHGGTYHNAHFGDGDIWNVENLADISCNGTPEAWIVFMPFPGDTVLLEFDATRGVRIKYSSYVKFYGFDIKGMGDVITFEEVQAAWGLYKDANGNIHDLAEEMGIDITDPELWGQYLDKPVTENIQKPSYFNGIGLMDFKSHHIIMENNTVRWAPASGLRVQKSDYTLVKGNRIYNNTMRSSVGVGAITVAEAEVLPEGDDYDGIKIEIIGNEVYNNENQIYSWAPSKSFIHFVIDEGSGIFLTRNNDTYDHGYMFIANNLSYRNGASGIVVHRTNRAIVEHNTVYDNGTTNGPDTKPGGIGFNTTDDVTIRNNISWSKPYKFALGKVGGDNTNLVIDSNLLFNDNGSEPVAKQVSSGWFEADPSFLNVVELDFRLSNNSPAINRGIVSNLVTDDIAGFPRNDGKPDLGAYEFDSTISVIDWQEKSQKGLLVYPNPSTSIVYIRLSSDEVNEIQLYGMNGESYKCPVQRTGNDKARLDLSMLPHGLYLLMTSSGTAKILKQ